MQRSAFLFVVALSVAAAAQTYTIFDVPNATTTVPRAINRNGAVVGVWYSPSGSGSFLRNGKGLFVKVWSGNKIGPRAINSTGTIAGQSFSNKAFMRTSQGLTTFFSFGQHSTVAVSVNDAGTMAGYYYNVSGPAIGWTGTATNYTALTLQDGTNIIPYAINTAGNVAGDYVDKAGTSHGVVWSSAGTTEFSVPGATGTLISTLDDVGYFAGEWWEGTLNEVNHCFVNDINGLATIDPAGATQCYVTGRNKAGVTVGYYYDTAGVPHGFRRGPKGVITTIDPPGSVDTYVQGINAGGKMVGYYFDAAGAGHGFTYVP